MKIGQVLTFKAKTEHGKKIIREASSNRWVVEQIQPKDKVKFNTDAPGPFLMVRLAGEFDRRWVSEIDDDHFQISESILPLTIDDAEPTTGIVGVGDPILTVDTATKQITEIK